MVKLFYRPGCGSSQRTKIWLEEYRVENEALQLRNMRRQDLLKLIAFTDLGLDEILKRRSKFNSKKLAFLDTLNFNAGIDFLLENTDLLKTPILLDEKNYLIGFNEDAIRKFLPKEYRNRNYY